MRIATAFVLAALLTTPTLAAAKGRTVGATAPNPGSCIKATGVRAIGPKPDDPARAIGPKPDDPARAIGPKPDDPARAIGPKPDDPARAVNAVNCPH